MDEFTRHSKREQISDRAPGCTRGKHELDHESGLGRSGSQIAELSSERPRDHERDSIDRLSNSTSRATPLYSLAESDRGHVDEATRQRAPSDNGLDLLAAACAAVSTSASGFVSEARCSTRSLHNQNMRTNNPIVTIDTRNGQVKKSAVSSGFAAIEADKTDSSSRSSIDDSISLLCGATDNGLPLSEAARRSCSPFWSRYKPAESPPLISADHLDDANQPQQLGAARTSYVSSGSTASNEGQRRWFSVKTSLATPECRSTSDSNNIDHNIINKLVEGSEEGECAARKIDKLLSGAGRLIVEHDKPHNTSCSSGHNNNNTDTSSCSGNNNNNNNQAKHLAVALNTIPEDGSNGGGSSSGALANGRLVKAIKSLVNLMRWDSGNGAGGNHNYVIDNSNNSDFGCHQNNQEEGNASCSSKKQTTRGGTTALHGGAIESGKLMRDFGDDDGRGKVHNYGDNEDVDCLKNSNISGETSGRTTTKPRKRDEDERESTLRNERSSAQEGELRGAEALSITLFCGGGDESEPILVVQSSNGKSRSQASTKLVNPRTSRLSGAWRRRDEDASTSYGDDGGSFAFSRWVLTKVRLLIEQTRALSKINNNNNKSNITCDDNSQKQSSNKEENATIITENPLQDREEEEAAKMAASGKTECRAMHDQADTIKLANRHLDEEPQSGGESAAGSGSGSKSLALDKDTLLRIGNILKRKKRERLERDKLSDKKKRQNVAIVEKAPYKERDVWGKNIEFLLAVIGFAVDLGNVWRFPYVCYKNGGGAFLIPYTILFVLGGLPIFYMEMSLGQYFSSGCLTIWHRVCPIAKGIGYSMCILNFFTGLYYNTIISWAVFFFWESFTTTSLPWTSCNNTWNLDSCRTIEQRQYNSKALSYNDNNNNNNTANYDASISTNSSILNDINNNSSLSGQHIYTSPTQDYFKREVLQIHLSSGIDDLGDIRKPLALYLAIVFVFIYFAIWKGVKSTGKAVWITALLPYFILIPLLIRGVFLPGAWSGIKYYLSPQWASVTDMKVWVEAAKQIYFSLGPGFGTLMALSSYNKFNHNTRKDALIAATVNYFASFISGFVIFSVLGYMAVMSDDDISHVATEGPGLVFEVYPEGLATMQFAPLWSCFFFTMVVTLGIDSTFGGLESVITGLCDEYPRSLRRHRGVFIGILIVIIYICSLPTTTDGGNYVIFILESYGTSSLLLIVLIETIVVCWIYGTDKFCANLQEMSGKAPSAYWRICWKYISPTILLIIFVAACGEEFTKYNTLRDDEYTYPDWAPKVGLLITGSSVICIPAYAIYHLAFKTNGSFYERLKCSFKPGSRQVEFASNQNNNNGGESTNQDDIEQGLERQQQQQAKSNTFQMDQRQTVI